MEYLKIAQDLDMYGVNYFLIRVSQCCFSTVCIHSKPESWQLIIFMYFSFECKYKMSYVS